jgi:hypothetical protein
MGTHDHGIMEMGDASHASVQCIFFAVVLLDAVD